MVGAFAFRRRRRLIESAVANGRLAGCYFSSLAQRQRPDDSLARSPDGIATDRIAQAAAEPVTSSTTMANLIASARMRRTLLETDRPTDRLNGQLWRSLVRSNYYFARESKGFTTLFCCIGSDQIGRARDVVVVAQLHNENNESPLQVCFRPPSGALFALLRSGI